MNPQYINQTIGIDPGSVNFSIGKIEFKGFRYNDDYTEEIPIFKPINIEHWNLKTGVGIRNSIPYEGGKCEIFNIVKSNELHAGGTATATTINSWISSLDHFILNSNWIFESYIADINTNQMLLPTISVENQFDHIKSHGNKFDMYLISNTVQSSIHMCDIIKNKDVNSKSSLLFSYRKIIKSSLKYGIRNNGSLVYTDRKAEVINITRSLFKLLELDNWIVFLDSVLAMGQKIDDLCDALLLALQSAIDSYEESIKTKNKQLPLPSSSSSNNDRKLRPDISTISFPDDNDRYFHNDKDKNKKTKNINKKPIKRKRNDEDNNDEKVTKKKRYSKKNKKEEKEKVSIKKKKKKKSNIITSSTSSSSSSSYKDKPKKRIIKKKNKMSLEEEEEGNGNSNDNDFQTNVESFNIKDKTWKVKDKKSNSNHLIDTATKSISNSNNNLFFIDVTDDIDD